MFHIAFSDFKLKDAHPPRYPPKLPFGHAHRKSQASDRSPASTICYNIGALHSDTSKAVVWVV